MVDQDSESLGTVNSRRKRINYLEIEDNDRDFEFMLQIEQEKHINSKQRIANGDGEVCHRTQQLRDCHGTIILRGTVRSWTGLAAGRFKSLVGKGWCGPGGV